LTKIYSLNFFFFFAQGIAAASFFMVKQTLNHKKDTAESPTLGVAPNLFI